MDINQVRAVTNASIVCGSMQGLAEGIEHWNREDITEEMLPRLVEILRDNHSKMRQVVDFLLALAAEKEGV